MTLTAPLYLPYPENCGQPYRNALYFKVSQGISFSVVMNGICRYGNQAELMLSLPHTVDHQSWTKQTLRVAYLNSLHRTNL